MTTLKKAMENITSGGKLLKDIERKEKIKGKHLEKKGPKKEELAEKLKFNKKLKRY